MNGKLEVQAMELPFYYRLAIFFHKPDSIYYPPVKISGSNGAMLRYCIFLRGFSTLLDAAKLCSQNLAEFSFLTEVGGGENSPIKPYRDV